MNRIALTLLLVIMTATVSAQDVVRCYNLSKISSYIKVDKIGPATFDILKDSIDSLHERYHSVDFVLDFLHTEGGYGMNAVILADSITKYNYRLGILIGPHTKGAAEQTAMFLRNAKAAILVGATTPGGLTADFVLESNDEHLTQWYDSICRHKIVEKAVRRYVSEHDVKSKYPTANDILKEFKDNAVLIDLVNEVGESEGIRKNDAAFYYSGFTVVSELRAELIHQVFPDDVVKYYEALNVPVKQAIFDARRIIESADYRKIHSGEPVNLN